MHCLVKEDFVVFFSFLVSSFLSKLGKKEGRKKREREEKRKRRRRLENKKKKNVGQSCLIGSSKSISLVHCLHCQGKIPKPSS